MQPRGESQLDQTLMIIRQWPIETNETMWQIEDEQFL
jgi:hypothetical protein